MKSTLNFIVLTLIAMSVAHVTVAADSNQADDPKQLQGISIKGNKETPKSLYIVPWHNAEHEQSTSLSSSLVDDSMQAIDQESLQRQLRLHGLSKSGWHRLSSEQP